MLAAAGGSVRTLAGEPLRYGKAGLENPHFVASGLDEAGAGDGSHAGAIARASRVEQRRDLAPGELASPPRPRIERIAALAHNDPRLPARRPSLSAPSAADPGATQPTQEPAHEHTAHP